MSLNSLFIGIEPSKLWRCRSCTGAASSLNQIRWSSNEDMPSDAAYNQD